MSASSWKSARIRQLKAITPDRWFLAGFVVLMLAFLVVLALEPGSVGRGGR